MQNKQLNPGHAGKHWQKAKMQPKPKKENAKHADEQTEIRKNRKSGLLCQTYEEDSLYLISWIGRNPTNFEHRCQSLTVTLTLTSREDLREVEVHDQSRPRTRARASKRALRVSEEGPLGASEGQFSSERLSEGFPLW